MRFGFAVPAYGAAVERGIAELLAAGEELGFDSAWWPDHIAVPDYAVGNLSPQQAQSFVRTAYTIVEAISNRTLVREE